MPLPEVCFHHRVIVNGQDEEVYDDAGHGMEEFPTGGTSWSDCFCGNGEKVGETSDGKPVVHTHEVTDMYNHGIPVKIQE
jgi:hypothetical protein